MDCGQSYSFNCSHRQRISLGLLNYLRSVERTLTFDLSGLQLEGGELCSTAEETGWMNTASGGKGEAGGLGSLQHSHNTPVDNKVRTCQSSRPIIPQNLSKYPRVYDLSCLREYSTNFFLFQVHCSEFMEFAEVENLHDFYSADGRFVHTQDHRGFYIVYNAALKDLQELEDELLLVGSRFIQRSRIRTTGSVERATTTTADVHSCAGTDVDRFAVLLHLWTCETEFLESKVQVQ